MPTAGIEAVLGSRVLRIVRTASEPWGLRAVAPTPNRENMIRIGLFACLLALSVPWLADAGQAPPASPRAAENDEPPAPIPPEVITRNDAKTQATVRAVRLSSPLHIDGKLD